MSDANDCLLLRAGFRAALRWMYLDTADHVRAKSPPNNRGFDGAYLSDVAAMRAAYAVLQRDGGIHE